MNKPDLIRKIKTLEALTNTEKSDLIGLLTNTKKYGLLWEDKPEEVEKDLLTKLPILHEVPELRILAKDLPVPAEKTSGNNNPNQPGLFDLVNPEQPTTNNQQQTTNNEQQTTNPEHQTPNHILIEGDNLHALTALTFTHEGKIDVIYIDPPYNTGNKDFKYNDSFVDREDSYRHSKWLSFMHKRLQIAKRLLSDKGVIFISIDDNEQAQLRLLCDEIFIEENIVAQLIWRTDGNFDNQAQIKNCHEYILVFSKSASSFKVSSKIDPNVNEDSKLYKENIQNTIVKNGPKNPISEIKIPAGFPTLFEKGVISKRNNKYPHYLNDLIIEDYETQTEVIVRSGWASKAMFELFIKNGYKPVVDTKNQLTEFKISQTGSIEAIKLRSDQSHVISVLMNMGNTQSNSNRLLDMGVKFSYPKPQSLIEYILSIIPLQSTIILDFFAGSGTTLHATMQLNAEDGGNRQCILVTNNENNICEEVTWERNKRVIRGYTNAKGQEVPGLTNNNMRYYKTGFAGREKTNKNKRELTLLATELLCIKADIYTETSQAAGFTFNPKTARCFSESNKYMLVIYDEEIIEQIIPVITAIQTKHKIKIYVFAPGQYPFTEEFEEVLDKIELCALPDAIYKAYAGILPKKSDSRFSTESNQPTENPVPADVTEVDLFTANTPEV